MGADEDVPNAQAPEQPPAPAQPPPTPQTAPAPPPAPNDAFREDMLQNAVAFLTHPKVKDSPEDVKRSFLDRKGLTTAEVDEAFRRVLPTQQQAHAPPATPVQGPSGLVTYQQQHLPQQAPQQYQQGAIVAQPHQGYTFVPSATQQGGMLVPTQPQAPAPQEPVRWSQVVLGIGVLAAGLYAVKSLVLPYVHNAYQSWSDKARAQREAQEQQQRALSELVMTMNACKEELSSNSQKVGELVSLMQAQHADQAIASQRAESSSAALTKELASLKSALQQLHPHIPALPFPNGPSTAAEVGPRSMFPYPPLLVDRSASSSPSHHSSVLYPGGLDRVLPPPAGYRGGYQEPAQHSPAVSSAVTARQQGSPLSTLHTSNGITRAAAPGFVALPDAPNNTPYPPSFMEVMDMVSKGVTPSNVRSDINDQPPDPNRPPSEPRLPPRSKPWESTSTAQASSLPFLLHNTTTSMPKAANGSDAPLPLQAASAASSPSTSRAPAAQASAASPVRTSSPPHNASMLAAPGTSATSLLHSSQEWLGAMSPEIPSSMAISSTEQALGEGSKLDAAAKPFAPAWPAQAPHQLASPTSAALSGEAAAEPPQVPIGSPSYSPIFQGLEREVRAGVAEGQQPSLGHQAHPHPAPPAEDHTGSISRSTFATMATTPLPPAMPPPAGAGAGATAAEAASAAPKPLSVLQPNPSWKPPPPPPRSIPSPPLNAPSPPAVSMPSPLPALEGLQKGSTSPVAQPSEVHGAMASEEQRSGVAK